MDLQLSGQVAIVTGSSRGIGAAIARSLAKEGATVVVNYSRDREGAQSVCAEIEAAGGHAAALQADVADSSAVEAMVNQTVDRLGRLDILVNNAAVTASIPLLQTSLDQFDHLVNTNLRGTWNCLQSAAPHMVRARYGRILNFSSVAALVPTAGYSVYSATKAAILSLTLSMAGELAPYNILVNACLPGSIETSMTERARQERGDQMLDNIGLRRFGQPEDLAALATFLVSPLNSYVSGAFVRVDGAKLAVQNPMKPWKEAGLIP